MLTIGITGGIASGKTEVAKVFQKKGATVISGDEIGKEVVEEKPTVLKKLVQAFGKGILNSKDKLNRKKLGEIAFASEKNKEKLNRIVHPYLLKELEREITKFRKTQNPRKILVVDAALIVEWKLYKKLDKLILVTSPKEKRVQRLKNLKFSETEALNRIKRQLTDKQRNKYADVVISNHGSLKELKNKALAVWKRIKSA
ncbi:MAG TPA: dephospho-CoA kinase [candidate division Zixibacteria bacterium]|nr:dephospho-CoA kinase [candidate division Zixibacteria bacterium]